MNMNSSYVWMKSLFYISNIFIPGYISLYIEDLAFVSNLLIVLFVALSSIFDVTCWRIFLFWMFCRFESSVPHNLVPSLFWITWVLCWIISSFYNPIDCPLHFERCKPIEVQSWSNLLMVHEFFHCYLVCSCKGCIYYRVGHHHQTH